jgi:RNA-directed DNA polymerase
VPKPRLKAVQRRVLDGILGRIPPHPAAHGFRPSRSVLTYAAPHAGRAVVVRCDLRSFFPSVHRARVRAVFRAAGYPPAVARLLAGVCTHRTPAGVARQADPRDHDRLRIAHLPQGSPASPALANLCAYRLDVRLAALAAELGAAYTRYADDLAFSGGPDLAERADRLTAMVGRVALDEGFELNYRKLRVMKAGTRQHLAGVVVNERPNVGRDEYDRLKATLWNCVRRGPAGENRTGLADFRAHLRGRVAHVARLNPARGRRLLELWERVAWDEAPSPDEVT